MTVPYVLIDKDKGSKTPVIWMPEADNMININNRAYLKFLCRVFVLPDIAGVFFLILVTGLSVASIVEPIGHIHPQKYLPRTKAAHRKIRAGQKINSSALEVRETDNPSNGEIRGMYEKKVLSVVSLLATMITIKANHSSSWHNALADDHLPLFMPILFSGSFSLVLSLPCLPCRLRIYT